MVGYYSFALDVCTSVPLSSVSPYFRFPIIPWVSINGFSPNLVCALILWRSGLGLLMAKFRQFWSIRPSHDSGGVLSFHVFILFYRIGHNERKYTFGHVHPVNAHSGPLWKHAYSKILKFSPPRTEHFQIHVKISDIFHISAQNIDCGYS